MKKKEKKKETKSKSENNQKQVIQRRKRFEFFSASIPLLVGLSKPILLVGVIALFWSPISTMLDTIPFLIGRSSKITMGDLAIEIEKAIISDPPANVHSYLSVLSVDSLAFLLKHGFTSNHSEGYWCETTKEEIYGFHPGIRELEDIGLVRFVQEDKENCNGMWYWTLSDSGKEVYAYLKGVILEEFILAWEDSR